ncbi:MAG: L,D-transpeptidase/peptidoglycan binding protein [Patescibacteria group bacterium]|nr:L,D-transpeptidase/peptidoglycan binding protein [Patescibacteria group bacterium]
MKQKKAILLDGIYVDEDKFEAVKIEKEKESVPKKKRDIKEKKGSRKKYFLKAITAVFSTIFFLLIAFSLGIYFGFGSFYKNQAFPSVYVLGQHIGGKYKPEVEKIVRKGLDDTRIYFQIDKKEESVSLYDLGVIINADELARDSFKVGRTGKITDDFLSRLSSFVYWLSPKLYAGSFGKNTVDINYNINREKLEGFSKTLFEKYKNPGKNASIIIKGVDVEVLPSQYGEKIITDTLSEQIRIALNGLKEGDKVVLGLSKEKVAPSIQENNLGETVAKTRVIINKNVVLKFEEKTYSPTKEQIASWILFEEASGILVPKVAQESVEAYLNEVAKNIDITPINRKIRVENGVKEVVEEEGKEGRSLLVVDDAAKLKTALEGGDQDIYQNLIVVTVYPKEIRNDVLIANWDKYIDINVSTQTLVAYEKGGVQVGSWAVTTGKESTPTPVGIWLVHGKSEVTRMTGGTPGIDYYDLPNVHWVTWFKGGGFSIHEAYWRSSFGGADYVWSGSHGCVNATYDAALFIYNWAPIGTPVIVHY